MIREEALGQIAKKLQAAEVPKRRESPLLRFLAELHWASLASPS